jgi:hypothetical protein
LPFLVRGHGERPTDQSGGGHADDRAWQRAALLILDGPDQGSGQHLRRAGSRQEGGSGQEYQDHPRNSAGGTHHDLPLIDGRVDRRLPVKDPFADAKVVSTIRLTRLKVGVADLIDRGAHYGSAR